MKVIALMGIDYHIGIRIALRSVLCGIRCSIVLFIRSDEERRLQGLLMRLRRCLAYETLLRHQLTTVEMPSLKLV